MSRPTRVLTIGSIPTEWGGRSQGGVATFHSALLSEITRRSYLYRTRIVGVVPTNAEYPVHVPAPTFPPDRGGQARDLYPRILDRVHPDVVLFNHISNQWALAHARLNRGTPGIGVVHSWHALTFRRPEVDECAVRRRIQEAADGLEMLVFPSQFCLDEGRGHEFRYPARTAVIGNPLASLYLSTKGAEVMLSERDGVAFVGALVERKNPVALAEAAIAGGFKVRFAGDGDQRSQLEELASQAPNRIELLGSRSVEEIRELMLRSEVVCVPSASESFGIVFIEALACGTPVVGFAGTLDEIFAAVQGRFGEAVEDLKPDALAAAIARLRARRWPREEMRRAVLREFSPPRVVQRYASAFAELAAADD